MVTETDVETASDEPSASDWAVRYARRPVEPFEPTGDDEVRVELLTDPWSVWCWGFEPVRRTLELRYPTIEFRPLVGGMFEELPDPKELGFDLDRFFTMVHKTTGMPISRDAARTDRPTSTYPACIHTHAVRLLDPELEPTYVRALREAVYLDGRNVSRPEVAAEVARSIGIDPAEFGDAMDAGDPVREFEERLAALHEMGLHAYPTLIVTTGHRSASVEGFQGLANVLTIVESVTGRLHPARPPPELVDILHPVERVATREVAEVLGCSIEQAVDRLQDAAAEGLVRRERHPGGDVWSLEASG